MSDVKRYYRNHTDTEGEFVLYADYANAIAERDTLRAVERLTVELEIVRKHNTELERDLASLRVVHAASGRMSESVWKQHQEQFDQQRADIERLQSKYHEAVALLRRWDDYLGYHPGVTPQLTKDFLATIDAEEAKSEEGTG
jgi:GMP synthase-like glutamine amidotransferase